VADEVAEAYENPELLGVLELFVATKLLDTPELFAAAELLVARELLGRAVAEIPAATVARLRMSSGTMVLL
jgi:hypothetical protein